MSGSVYKTSSKVTQKRPEINFRNLRPTVILPFMETSNKVTIAVIIILIAGAIGFGIFASKSGTHYDEFAQCLKDQGAQFFGAFWCPHCQAQEKEFGMSRQKLEAINLYNECSTPDANGQTQICIDNKVEGYPTWTFAKPIVITAVKAPITNAPGKNGNTSQIFTQWILTMADGDSVQVMTTSTPTVTGEGDQKVYTFDQVTSRISGETSLELLSAQTNCPLPQK
jgi:hypothetical protein